MSRMKRTAMPKRLLAFYTSLPENIEAVTMRWQNPCYIIQIKASDRAHSRLRLRQSQNNTACKLIPNAGFL